MMRYGAWLSMLLALALTGCAQDAPRTRAAPAAPLVAMRGPQSTLAPAVPSTQIVICECEMTCSTTGAVFSAAAPNSVTTACSRARSQCRGQCAGGTCTQTFAGCG